MSILGKQLKTFYIVNKKIINLLEQLVKSLTELHDQKNSSHFKD